MHEENHNKIKKIFENITAPKAIIIAGVLIAGAIIVSQIFFDKNQGLQNATQKITGETGNVQLLNKVNDSDDFIRGAKKPKITIVEFSDFGCSFCASFHPTLRNLVEKYPNDIAWVYRHLPYRNKEAALASECVGQRLGDEAFWQYSDILFAKFPNITNDVLVEEAIKLGFENKEAFQECTSSEDIAKAVQENFTEAGLIGASGTPHSILVTKEGKYFPIRGAMQAEQLDQMIQLLIQ